MAFPDRGEGIHELQVRPPMAVPLPLHSADAGQFKKIVVFIIFRPDLVQVSIHADTDHRHDVHGASGLKTVWFLAVKSDNKGHSDLVQGQMVGVQFARCSCVGGFAAFLHIVNPGLKLHVVLT